MSVEEKLDRKKTKEVKNISPPFWMASNPNYIDLILTNKKESFYEVPSPQEILPKEIWNWAET